MIVAAHQPHYFPWLGYIHKMAQADLFIVMDDLQYEKDNFQNRNRIKVNNCSAWITVPLERGSQSDRICDKLIRNDGVSAKEHWQRRTWATLQIHYGKAPYFSDYARRARGAVHAPVDAGCSMSRSTSSISCAAGSGSRDR